MERVLKTALVNFLAAEVPSAAVGFAPRKLTRPERALYSIAPVACFSRRSGIEEQFISFVPANRGPSSRFFVECGWFSSAPIPHPTVESTTLVRIVEAPLADFPSQFSVRLFWLCADRGNAETFWDLFSPDVWDPARETYREFRSQRTFAATDEALRVFSSGGPTAEYAQAQARLVAGECVSCIQRWAIPFLERRRQSLAALSG